MHDINIVYENDIILFRNRLLLWYYKNGRDYPWRKKSATNYQLILAEIFLQRTKAETVSKFLPYFFTQYPNWKHLGNASEEEIQEIIRPLGLYRQRGSRLYKLAQELKSRKGRMPQNRDELQELPMMGQYITNAFELYVLKKRRPLLDVNMSRVLERFFGKRGKSDIRYDPYLQSLAYRVIDIPESKELNWGILDFAAITCRKKPLCNLCPIYQKCDYFKINN